MSTRSQQTSFLPDFCGNRIVFVVIILAELLAIVLTLAQPSDMPDRLYYLSIFSLFAQWIALSCIAVLCLCQRWLNRLSDMWAATISYLITLAVSLVVVEMAWWLFSDWRADQGWLLSEHVQFLFKSMSISAIVSALALRYFYVRHQWGRRIKSESESRFQALQSRIRPHFLFNCMNTIASLTRRNPALAEQVIEDLSGLFRVTLGDARNQGTLRDEVELCNRYLRIEAQRLGDRLEVDWQMQGIPDDMPYPALCLQPLIENAIYHGIERLPGGGKIVIQGKTSGRHIEIQITNPVPGDSQDRHRGNQLAQANVRERLAALFNEEGLLDVAEESGRYVVCIRVPLNYEDIDR